MKSPEIEKFLEENFGRSTALKEKKCVAPPVGCGKPIEGFRDELSVKEYGLTGWCQECQDAFYGKG